MISWDSRQVAQFLRAEPAIAESQFSGPQFTFEFPVADLLARLVVFPRDCDVWLRLFPRSSEEDVVSWRLACDRIVFSDEIEEEGGPGLAFHGRVSDAIAAHPRHPIHFLTIGKRAGQFVVGSSYLRE